MTPTPYGDEMNYKEELINIRKEGNKLIIKNKIKYKKMKKSSDKDLKAIKLLTKDNNTINNNELVINKKSSRSLEKKKKKKSKIDLEKK
jgi:hypothetical protein